MLDRKLKLKVPKGQSIFLWGARKTGKSSLLKSRFPDSVFYDFLNTESFIRYTKSPHLFREEILALDATRKNKPVIIDEIQKIPELLNEIHWLIENQGIQFILCGSSARKLKTQSTNLLGGRAWPFYFYPLVYTEIPDFDLLKAIQHGLIPSHYLSSKRYVNKHFQAYVDIYLKDEIRNEGLVRNLRGFSNFLDVAGLCNGEMINASNIARDCGIDNVTVQSYYQILIDTMLGYYIYPYRKRIKRDLIIAKPKFYFFDVGGCKLFG